MKIKKKKSHFKKGKNNAGNWQYENRFMLFVFIPIYQVIKLVMLKRKKKRTSSLC